MDSRSRTVFLLLIIAQAAHSIEEYVFRLYEVFMPARLISSLIGTDLALGFAVFNISLVAFGVWCYLARVRPAHHSAAQWVWPWVIVEVSNGIVHPAVALWRGDYFPGVVTAPVLLALASYLGLRLMRQATTTGQSG
jgi:Protein of unknown function with HXXEE motif